MTESRKLVFKETAIIAIGEVICVALMCAVYALIGKFSAAVLLGGIQGYRAWDATNRMNQQAALEDREDEKTKLEQRAASIQREIDHQREYLEESILMQLDYYDIHEAKVSCISPRIIRSCRIWSTRIQTSGERF